MPLTLLAVPGELAYLGSRWSMLGFAGGQQVPSISWLPPEGSSQQLSLSKAMEAASIRSGARTPMPARMGPMSRERRALSDIQAMVRMCTAASYQELQTCLQRTLVGASASHNFSSLLWAGQGWSGCFSRLNTAPAVA